MVLTSFGELEIFLRRKAVPGQCIVYGDSNVLGFRSFIQGLSVNVVASLYDFLLVGDPDMFALVYEAPFYNLFPIFWISIIHFWISQNNYGCPKIDFWISIIRFVDIQK